MEAYTYTKGTVWFLSTPIRYIAHCATAYSLSGLFFLQLSRQRTTTGPAIVDEGWVAIEIILFQFAKECLQVKYVKLGRTGLEVSRICLGCMSFGIPDRGTHEWTLNEEQSRPIIKRALELGINFFDTANMYSDGTSEEIVGRALKDFARRDEIVIATKVYNRTRPGPNGMGLSRKAIMSEIDHSLRRLGTDYVDLYQIHRWDDRTPIEETMEALHDVRSSHL